MVFLGFFQLVCAAIVGGSALPMGKNPSAEALILSLYTKSSLSTLISLRSLRSIRPLRLVTIIGPFTGTFVLIPRPRPGADKSLSL